MRGYVEICVNQHRTLTETIKTLKMLGYTSCYFPFSKIFTTGLLGEAVPGVAEEETKNVKGSGLGY